MNTRHKIIREMLRHMPVPEAKNILETNLPEREFVSIFYSRDVSGECDLNSISDMLNTTERNVKAIRRNGYEKLSAIYFKN